MSEKLRYNGIDNYGHLKRKKTIKVYPIILGIIFLSVITYNNTVKTPNYR